jgi:hypothetical protein
MIKWVSLNLDYLDKSNYKFRKTDGFSCYKHHVISIFMVYYQLVEIVQKFILIDLFSEILVGKSALNVKDDALY